MKRLTGEKSGAIYFVATWKGDMGGMITRSSGASGNRLDGLQ